MKLSELNHDSLKDLSNKEVLNIHYRIHQLYSIASRRDSKEIMSNLRKAHSLIVSEFKKRGMIHNSPL